MPLHEKPHLLTVLLSDTGNGGVDFKIECPHEPSETMSCAVHWECGHSEPQTPWRAEPSYTWDGEKRVYAETGEDPLAVEAWNTFWDNHDGWLAQHPHGPYHVDAECWVVQAIVNGSLEDNWELKGFANVPIDGPVKVDWENDGGIEDSHLVLRPWSAS